MNHRSEDRQPPSTKPGEPGAGCLIKWFISHQSDKVQASRRGSKVLLVSSCLCSVHVGCLLTVFFGSQIPVGLGMEFTGPWAAPGWFPKVTEPT